MFWLGAGSGCNTSVLVSAVPVPLRHLSKCEVLAQIDLMEDQFDVLMWFDLDHIPANSTPTAVGEEVQSWGYGVAVFGAARGPRRDYQMRSLMGVMYGFVSKEEMSDAKDFLRAHGKYQLEQVSIT